MQYYPTMEKLFQLPVSVKHGWEKNWNIQWQLYFSVISIFCFMVGKSCLLTGLTYDRCNWSGYTNELRTVIFDFIEYTKWDLFDVFTRKFEETVSMMDATSHVWQRSMKSVDDILPSSKIGIVLSTGHFQKLSVTTNGRRFALSSILGSFTLKF